MTPEQAEHLREVLFERLVSGESRDALLAGLISKLGEAEAMVFINTTVQRIREQHGGDGRDSLVGRIRKRRLGARYRGWRILGWVLLGWGLLSGLASLMLGGGALPLAPVLVGVVILALVEFETNRRISEAQAAVDQLLGEAPAL